MPIKEKRKYLRWFFCASFGFAFIILLVGAFGYLTVSELGKETVRDKEFDVSLTKVRQSYENAFNLGQRKMLGQNFNGEIQDERLKALHLTEEMQAAVSNNFRQSEDALNLHRLMERRFNVQDTQYATMKRTASGEIVYDEQTIKQSVETNNLINQTFVRLRETSGEMFRQKHARILIWQYWLAIFLLSAVILLLISLAVLYYYNVKHLDKAEKVGNRMDGMVKESTTDHLIISKDRASEFVKFLREETTELR